MKKILTRAAIVSAVCGIAILFIQSLTRNQGLTQVLFTAVLSAHVQPKAIDDKYSHEAYTYYLKRLDPQKQFFIQADINKLSPYTTKIDDELMKGTFHFFELSNDLLSQRTAQINSFYPSVIDNPINFSDKDAIEVEAKKRVYPKTVQELQAYWRQLIKNQILSEYLSLYEAKAASENKQYAIKYSPALGKVDPVLEKKARLKVKDALKAAFKRRMEEKDEDKRELFFDTLVSVFDAHTGYFPPEKKEDFDISISGKLEGIGAVLTEKDGMIRVEKIIPGSASWKQGELAAEDIILKVAQADGEAVEMTGLRVQDAVKYIRGKKGTTIRLTVKKPSGKVTVISLVRDVVLIEETYAKSVIIQDKRSNKKIGYIYLPKFYRDFSDNKGRNTTDDIRKLVKQLNASHVDGIVFDLRNNEGGALDDAVETAGLFIKTGPIVQVKSKNSDPQVYEDRDPSVEYDGPMVIMINTYSASAAEILAAALQDYKRAVVVGSSRSFGKGTVQIFYDIDKIRPDYAAMFNGLGAVKITIQKFYRINGKSTQYNGVASDVVLPDGNDVLEVGEKYLDYSLPFDSIEPVPYAVWKSSLPNTTDLQKKSQDRVKNNPRFTVLKAHLESIKRENKATLIPLDLASAFQRRKRIDDESKLYRDKQKPFTDLQFSRPDGVEAPTDTVRQASEKDFREALSKDVYLYEAMAVLNDVIGAGK